MNSPRPSHQRARTATLAVGATLSLALGALALVPGASAASDSADSHTTVSLPAADPAQLAAAWMTGNLTDGQLVTGAWSFPNTTLTLELAQALSAVGGHEPTLAAIDATFAQNVLTYTGGASPKGSETSRALNHVAVVRGQDPHAVGPDAVDLVARTEGLLVTGQPYQGRLTGGTAWVQAYAAAGLAAAGSEHADEVLDFTLQQQCAAGFFRLSLAATSDTNQGCDGSRDATAVQAADVTAAVVANLLPLAAENPTLAAALERAGDWLETQQKPDGSFVDQWSQQANANSTGLAAWALGALGRTEPAASAATWLRTRQVVGSCEPQMSSETGAVAYGDAAWADGAEYGIADAGDRMQWLMVGAQSIAGISHAPRAADSVELVVPTTVEPGAPVHAVVRGLAAGERACVSGAQTTALLGTGADLEISWTAGAEGTESVTLITASGERDAAVEVRAPITPEPTDTPTSTPTDTPTSTPTDDPTSTPTDDPTGTPTDTPTSTPTAAPTSAPTASPTVRPTAPTSPSTPTHKPAWPAKKFTVKAPKKVRPGARAQIVVRGAKAGERLTLKLSGRTVKRTIKRTANARGIWKGKVAVTGKRGKVVLKVTGQRAHRTGRAVIRVR